MSTPYYMGPSLLRNYHNPEHDHLHDCFEAPSFGDSLTSSPQYDYEAPGLVLVLLLQDAGVPFAPNHSWYTLVLLATYYVVRRRCRPVTASLR
jgi:hypothetical protein